MRSVSKHYCGSHTHCRKLIDTVNERPLWEMFEFDSYLDLSCETNKLCWIFFCIVSLEKYFHKFCDLFSNNACDHATSKSMA